MLAWFEGVGRACVGDADEGSEWARSQGRGEEWQAMADKLLEHEVDGDVLLAYEHCKHELRVHLVNHHHHHHHDHNHHSHNQVIDRELLLVASPMI